MILPFEKQVCSLESAKRLKELGFRQESLFYWKKILPYWKNENEEGEWVIRDSERESLGIPQEACSAYTVAELGELLPERLVSPMPTFILELCAFKETGEWLVGYKGEPSDKNIWITENTEAEARAKMLIYLAEEGLRQQVRITLPNRKGR